MKEGETWNLKDVLDPNKINDLVKKLEQKVNKFEAFRAILKPTISREEFKEIILLLEEIEYLESRIGGYASLKLTENTSDEKSRALETKIEQLLSNLGNKMVFFGIWWKTLDEQNAKRLIPETGKAKYFFETIRKFKEHTLTEPEEKIINLKDTTGINALISIYHLTTSTLTFNFKGKKLSQEELLKYVKNPKAEYREQAYKELFKVYKEKKDVLGDIYTKRVLDWKNECINLRKYKTPIEVKNKGNDIPEEAVQALLKTIRNNAETFQEYFKIKAKICKINKFSRYHIYAPYSTKEKKHSFNDAKRIVLESFQEFSPQIAQLAKKVLDEKHVHSILQKGKLTGAYCSTINNKITPYVLMNFTGTKRDVETLAHELGHAVHSLLSQKQTIFTFHPTLPLAETASIFSEQILLDKLLSKEKDTEAIKVLLISQLDDMYATIMRQAFFTIFEQKIHEKIPQGITTEEIAKEYYKNLKEQFGTIKIPEEFKWEWLYISHLYDYPFYCYAYSFGNLLTISLYEMYKKQGKSFTPKFIELLSAGGSDSPENITRKIGVDIKSEKFWQEGFKSIKERIKELRKI